MISHINTRLQPQVQFIIDAFRGHVPRMATHCYGSRVLQRIIEYCDPEQVAKIYDEIHANNLSVFIHDAYGNYVIQNMVEYGRQEDRDRVFAIVNKNMAAMSCHKFASNVVEKSIQQANRKDRQNFVTVSIGKPVLVYLRTGADRIFLFFVCDSFSQSNILHAARHYKKCEGLTLTNKLRV